jgi:hypothetical protein
MGTTSASKCARQSLFAVTPRHAVPKM